MRIDRLDLEKYGHFDGYSLDLSGEARLHIVHGANEAGKSTALAAICDLLFGVPERTRLGFRHGNAALRIGASLRKPDGDVLDIKRRKGRTRTLLAGDGITELPDGLLAPLLGGIDRGDFERLFGLDHPRLRQGGEAMLAAGGDLARILFQAGSGLTGITDLTTALAAEADRLGSPARKQASKPLYEALDAHQAATARMRNEATKAEAWATAQAQLASATEKLARVQADLAAAQQERSRLERQRRVRPILARLVDIGQELAGLADAPDLPATLDADWRRAETGLREAHRRADEAVERHAQAAADLAAAGPAPRLPDLATAIEELFRQVGTIDKARADLPRRVREQEQMDERLALLAARIGRTGTDAASLEQALPAPVLAARIRDRIKGLARLEGSRDAAEKRAQAIAQQAELAEQSDIGTVEGDPAAAEAALNAALPLLGAEARLQEAERQMAEREDQLARLCRRLTGWQGDARALSALPLPALTLVERHLARHDQIAKSRQDQQAEETALKAEITRHERTLAALKAEGDVPTPTAIAEARRDRDQSWTLIRRRFLDKADVPVTEWSAFFGPNDPAPRLENALRTADDLVDRRAREAQRVADHLRAEADLADARTGLKAVEALGERLTAEQAALATEWQSLWAPSTVTPGEPAAMVEWLRLAGDILSRLEAQEQTHALLAERRREMAQCADYLHQALVLAGQAPAAGETALSQLRIRAETAVKQCRQHYDQHHRALTERQRIHRQLKDAEREKQAAQDALADWRQGWAGDMAILGLPAQAGAAEAEAALDAWTDIATQLQARHDLAHRIDRLREDIAAFTTQARDLATKALALEPRLDAQAAADPAILFNALRDAREEAARHAGLVEALSKAEAAEKAARTALATAQATLDDLRTLHRLDAQADIPALVALSARRRERQAAEKAVLDELAGAGDGLTLAELETDLADSDPDALSRHLAEKAMMIGELQKDLPDASAQARDAERALEALRQRAGIGEAAHDAAAAEAKAADVAQRWLRLRAAGLLLGLAVERYRDRNEHPLLRRASAVLAAMAASGGNPVTHLKVDYGDADHPVLLGVRGDGSDAHVQDMSEGLRDQLFLALRIAAVEAHIAQATPLPFIADDLFITSDEPRTAAGLVALTELGAATQVILFTHHRYVVDAARELDGVRVHHLG
ncbi:ATP-binding protein [Niveispirillum irakense]|uniref:ATP-binding protein n=1 Tax=Niveispirillum irakense TaxID=34011 RepID=UPI0003FF27D9|nr:YhaN family protein [Niveispirillum irakense]